jgi:hypothetical protein
MSLGQDYLDRLLKLDIESYLRGKGPSAVALSEAPLIEDWRVDLVDETTEGPSSILVEDAMVLTGRAQASGGELVATTRLIWLDRNCACARTTDGLYQLGRTAPAYGGNVRSCPT